MFRVFVKFRRNSDGEYCTIDHVVETRKEALRWLTCIENALNKSEDEYVDSYITEEENE